MAAEELRIKEVERGDDPIATYRLFQLISPSLPIGGFTYSQGLEWAVEAGWVKNRVSMVLWLENILRYSVATLELPLIDRFYQAIETRDIPSIEALSNLLCSSRETKELRAEEIQRGKALNVLLKQLDIPVDDYLGSNTDPNQLVGLCVAGYLWGISPEAMKQGYLWSWAENLVMAGVKLVPLGQTDGQRALMELTLQFPEMVSISTQIDEVMIGSFTPIVSLASSLHETQYTRLFRS
ncbi:urease accessory protein UreF [Photobacterium sp. DNB23_23_1]|uniref:Urease accessory protein UreF n=1 Tax=Photobacterium pectinilyticum TaxID=2906793 RepID=A0ABT1N3H3_9GAMM|nr:urease accessory protein UreF [Photobacterium sp. ZSDE20]MCQ1058662.1 urease accessory protein UreF [Photobacterium sp. ZSDE20]MDD1823376.1 urease accessory protein UreF [Photobacterium sp. ZSDE20]